RQPTDITDEPRTGNTGAVPKSRSELILPGFDAYNAGGAEGFLEWISEEDLMHPDFTFRIQEDLPLGGEWRGAEGLRETLRAWHDAWAEFSIEVLDSTEGPDGQVLLEVEQHAVAKGSGLELNQPGFFYVALFRDGRIAEMHLLTDRERARELAGLAG